MGEKWTPTWRRATRRDSALLFFLALALYLPLASFTVLHLDTEAAATPAWTLVHTGSVDLTTTPLSSDQWYFEWQGGVYSNRFPGVVLYATPFYLLSSLIGYDHIWVPGVVAGAVVTAGAVALMFGVVARLGTSRAGTWFAALVFAFGGATWTVSADGQWPHGISQLLICAGTLALASRRWGLSGLLLGFTVFVRPQMAPAVVLVGAVMAYWGRSWRLGVRFGLGALAGVAALIGYHGVTLGIWSIDNGHAVYAGAEDFGKSLAALPINVVGTLVDPMRGVLLLYPALFVAALGVRRAWQSAPQWARAVALSGVVALATQLSLNRYSGGDTFFGSRLTIEALTLAFPLLTLAWGKAPERARSIGVLLLGCSVVLHAMGAVAYPYVLTGVFPLGATALVTALVAIAGFVLARRHVSSLAPWMKTEEPASP